MRAGTLVRYREGGPRGAKSGSIGVVADPSSLGKEKGWVRVGFSGIYDDYSPDELEDVAFWAVSVMYPTEWCGPYGDWRLAQLAVARLISERSSVADDTPLAHKRDTALSLLENSRPSVSGLLLYLDPGGEFRIVVAGQNQPSLYDKSGKKYA